jgi:hypothetical protein
MYKKETLNRVLVFTATSGVHKPVLEVQGLVSSCQSEAPYQRISPCPGMSGFGRFQACSISYGRLKMHLQRKF